MIEEDFIRNYFLIPLYLGYILNINEINKMRYHLLHTDLLYLKDIKVIKYKAYSLRDDIIYKYKLIDVNKNMEDLLYNKIYCLHKSMQDNANLAHNNIVNILNKILKNIKVEKLLK